MLFGDFCFLSHEISSQLNMSSQQRPPSVYMTRGKPFFSDPVTASQDINMNP